MYNKIRNFVTTLGLFWKCRGVFNGINDFVISYKIPGQDKGD